MRWDIEVLISPQGDHLIPELSVNKQNRTCFHNLN